MHCGPKVKGFLFKMLTTGLLQIVSLPFGKKIKKIKKHLTQLQWEKRWVIKWETWLEIILLVIFSCCHFKSLPMILSCLWKVFVLTDKIFLNCLSTVSLSHDIQYCQFFHSWLPLHLNAIHRYHHPFILLCSRSFKCHLSDLFYSFSSFNF